MEKLERLMEEGKVLELGDNYYVMPLDTCLDLIQEEKEKVEDTRFYRWEKERDMEWAKFIRNNATGGDNDFIIFDSYRGEWTYGEHGVMPLCDSETLNRDYKDVQSLRDIIKGESR